MASLINDVLPEDEEGQALQDSECELLMLREQISMLTKQFYHDRQQWLEEKRRLQETAKLQQAMMASPSHQHEHQTRAQQRASSGMLGSEVGSDTATEDASQGGMSGREGCSSFSSSCPSSRSASPNQTGSASMSSSAASAVLSAGPGSTELFCALNEMQRQLEESRRQQESASVRWALEREALQRQIHALISMAGEAPASEPLQQRTSLRDGGAGSAVAAHGSKGRDAGEEEEERLQLAERVSELEALVEDLQAERENLEEQLRVVAADATRARLASRGAGAAASAAPADTPAPALRANGDGATSAPAPAPPPSDRRARDSGSGDGGGRPFGVTLRDSVSVPELLAAKAELERELKRLREECVAVPRAEYTELSSLRSQMAFLQSEMEALREEAEEAARLRAAAEEDPDGPEGDQGCVSVPHEEYQRLLRLDAEARTRGSAVSSAAQPHLCPQQQQEDEKAEEQGRLLAAVEQERDALAERLAALLETKARTESETEEAAKQETANAAAEQEQSRQDSEQPSSELAMLREQLAAAVGASVAESSRLGAQVSELREELEALRRQYAALVAECGAARHALVSGRAQASDEARAAAAAAEAARTRAEEEVAACQRRIAVLEGELAEARKAAEAAWGERERLSEEVAAVRDAALRTSVALAECLASRGGDQAKEEGAEGQERQQGKEAEEEEEAAEEEEKRSEQAAGALPAGTLSPTDEAASARIRIRALEEELGRSAEALGRTADALVECQARCTAAELAAAAASAASAAAVRELDATKLELAEARELGLLFQSKREAFQQSKRVIRNLPQEWICGGGSSGAAVLPPPAAAGSAAAAAIARLAAAGCGAAAAAAAAAERPTSFATSASTSTAGSVVASTADEEMTAAAAAVTASPVTR